MTLVLRGGSLHNCYPFCGDIYREGEPDKIIEENVNLCYSEEELMKHMTRVNGNTIQMMKKMKMGVTLHILFVGTIGMIGKRKNGRTGLKHSGQCG